MDSLADKVLGQKFAVDIILMIHRKGEVMLSDLDQSGWTTTNKRLTELESFGLIEYRMKPQGRSVPLWSLTELGAAVADHLIAIEWILADCGPEEQDELGRPADGIPEL